MPADDPQLTAGLEIHQQLDTDTKLFCHCPTRLREPSEASRILFRYLHPTRSELGELDEAAMEESRIDRRFEYLAYETTCLVEEDDEPPMPLNQAALETALEIAALLDMTSVDQAHVMRKLVVDGSNTSGFQRSVKLATDGVIETDDGVVRITDLMLEEESAQRIEALEDGVRYSLDRLGIPLVEIGTAPDITTPEQAKAVAEHIGMLLRSTRSVKRGLGTIRQDVNVSIPGGARVEIKGVQDLDLMEEIVRLEMERQQALIEISDELTDRDARVGDSTEVTKVFEETDSSIIAAELDAGGEVYAISLTGFDGIVGREIQPDRRLGSELADHARRHGVDGLFHTDELPGYGITDAEVSAVCDAVDAGRDDAVAIVAGKPEHARLAIEAAADRARQAIDGVPGETRDALPDGITRYLRPLAGAARMYPETDVPPIDIDMTDITVPELISATIDRYTEDYDLDRSLAAQVVDSRYASVFERAVDDLDVAPTVAARTVTATLTELRRDGVPVSSITEAHLLESFELLSDGSVPTEALPDLLRAVAAEPTKSVGTIADEAGLGGADETAVREVVEGVVEANEEQVRAEGMGAFSALMGECMAELRGQAEGELVSELLRDAIQQRQ